MVVIRQAGLDDIEDVVRLRVELLREVGNLKSGDNISELAATNSKYFNQKLPVGDCIVWVAEVDSQLVGISGLVRLEKPPVADNLSGVEGWVLNMYTAPEWRNQGIATALLQEIIAYARFSQIQRLWLHATASAENVYKKVGFVYTSSGDQTIATTEMELLL